MKKIKLPQVLITLSVIFCISSLPLLNFSSSAETLNLGKLLEIGEKHVARLYKLTLSGNANNVEMSIDQNRNQLNITNGVVVWSGSSSQSNLSSVWWWKNNTIDSNSNYAWIAWWSNNKISNWENSVIWGGSWNKINWSNWVVAWGQWNSAWSSWVVMWWQNNSASGYGVALWWQSNEAWNNSLVMWSWAGWNRAFARNAKAQDNSARIDAKSGVLIGTTESILWVNLVVSGAIKIVWNNSTEWQAWEIKVVSGCFYAYDWVFWHVISQTDPGNCEWFVETKTCKFGNVYLQQWDQVTWYNQTVDSSCKWEKVVCSGGDLVSLRSPSNTWYIHPYCHKI